MLFSLPDGVIEAQLAPTPGWPQRSGERHLAGHVSGLPQSWLRVSLDAEGNGYLAMFDGVNQFSEGRVRQQTLVEIGSRRPHKGSARLAQDARGTQSAVLRQYASAREYGYPPVGPVALKVDLAGDGTFRARYGTAWEFELLARLNLAAGILNAELGLAVQPGYRTIYDLGVFDKLTRGGFQAAAMALARARSRDLSSRGSAPGLLHLVSGHAKSSNNQEGISFDDVVCSSGGWDVGITLDGADVVWVMAHEIGHGLGAPHDEETNSCADEHSLMSEWLLDSTGVGMSRCSVQRVTERFSRSCFVRSSNDLSEQLLASGNAQSGTSASGGSGGTITQVSQSNASGAGLEARQWLWALLVVALLMQLRRRTQ